MSEGFYQSGFLIGIHGPAFLRMSKRSKKSLVNNDIKTAGIVLRKSCQWYGKALELFALIDNCNRYVFHDRVLPREKQESFLKQKSRFKKSTGYKEINAHLYTGRLRFRTENSLKDRTMRK